MVNKNGVKENNMNPDMSYGMADLMLYKFKKYLGSVSREIQNRRLKTVNNPRLKSRACVQVAT